MLDRGRRYEETVRSAALLKTVELMGLQLFNCIARVIEADLAGKLPAGGRAGEGNCSLDDQRSCQVMRQHAGI